MRERINNQIRAKEVRVLDSTNQNLGVLSIKDALEMAQNQGLDLIEISPNANPPIAKIMDFIAHGGLQKAKNEELERLKAEEKIQKIKNMQTSGQGNSNYWGHSLDGNDAGLTLDLIDWVSGLLKHR